MILFLNSDWYYRQDCLSDPQITMANEVSFSTLKEEMKKYSETEVLECWLPNVSVKWLEL